VNVKPLAPEIAGLLESLHAPSRLVAHLTLVHDVALTLTQRLDAAWPDLAYDRELVWLGAALHDVGKILHPEELTQPGHVHEQAGVSLLLARGYPARVARFCSTHAVWGIGAAEDLLVAIADHWWRGARNEPLEALVCGWITRKTGEDRWRVFATLDDLATAMSEGADERLAWQARFPAR
jgi:putative nucleotidyltransferase with HDIG domain